MAHSELLTPTRPPPVGLSEHIARTLSLAVPVMIARVGILLLVAVDTAMTGHFGTIALAHYGLAMAPHVFMLLIGIGLLMGSAVLTAQAEGAGDSRDTGRVLRVALLHAAGYGAVMAALCYGGEAFLLATGQGPALAEGAGRVLVIFGWGMPGMFLYTATVFFLEAIDRPLPGMFVMIAANILNLFLNWLMIFGHWGFSAGGAEGAALATTIVRWCMFLLAVGYVLVRVDHVRYGLRGTIPGLRALARKFRRIGYPLGIAHGLETSAFSTMTLFAGLLGAVQVAGYMIAMNLISLVFMCALGFATAASVRVGNAVGRRDPDGVRLAGWVSVGIASAFLISLGVVFYTASDWLTAIYTSEPAVAAIAAPTVLVAAFVLLPDGAQGVLMGALRGASDVWPATFLYLLSFWGVMIPTGYVLGVLENHGAPGLMTAVLASTLCAMILLGIRFHRVTRRAIKRA